MNYEDDDVLQGTDVEAFTIPYDERRRHNMSIPIKTPIGVKRVRMSQISIDDKHIFVHDMLRQQRWIAISSIQVRDGLICTVNKQGVAVALRDTTFLDELL